MCRKSSGVLQTHYKNSECEKLEETTAYRKASKISPRVITLRLSNVKRPKQKLQISIYLGLSNITQYLGILSINLGMVKLQRSQHIFTYYYDLTALNNSVHQFI